MKKQTILLLLISTNLLISCGYLTTKKYGIKKEQTFRNRQEYLSFFEKKSHLDPNQIYYVDSLHFIYFFQQLVSRDSTIIYLGCVKDDSIWRVKSDLLIANGSCKGRLDSELDKLVSRQDKINAEQWQAGPSLTNLGLRSVQNEKFISKRNDKKLVVLSYSYQFGTYYNDFYNKARVGEKKGYYDLIVVSLDPVYRLKP